MSDISPNRPPANISAAELFGTWLPAELERLRGAANAPTPPDLRTRVTVSGDGGGSWLYETNSGALSVTQDAGPADLEVAISSEDLSAVLDPAGGVLPEVPAGAAAKGPGLDKLFSGPLVDQAKSIRGALSFQLTGFKGRDFGASLTFGGTAEPAAVISVDADTYRAMLDGSLPPAQAYFSGKITVGGDAAFALQVGMGLMAAAVG